MYQPKETTKIILKNNYTHKNSSPNKKTIPMSHTLHKKKLVTHNSNLQSISVKTNSNQGPQTYLLQHRGHPSAASRILRVTLCCFLGVAVVQHLCTGNRGSSGLVCWRTQQWCPPLGPRSSHCRTVCNDIKKHLKSIQTPIYSCSL